MSSNHFQNNRVVHRNATSAVQIGIDTQSSIKKTNDKLDLALTQQTAVNTKLDSFSGAVNNASIGDGSVRLQTYVYGHDASAGQARALKVDATGRLECNVADIEIHTGEIEGAVENLELTVGTNTATAPTRALQVGGKYVDGTFRDIKVDNIGKVIIDTPTGSDLDTRLGTIGTNTTGLAGCVAGTELQVDVVSMPTTAVTLAGGATEAKQDVQETTLNAIQSAVELIDNAISGTEMQCDIVASLPAGTNAIGKLSANSGVDIGDVDVTSISAGTNRIGKVVLMGNEAADGSGTERHALLDSAGHLQVDVLSAPSTAVTNAGLTSLAAAVNSDRVDVNIAAGGFDGAVTNAGLTSLAACIGTDGSGTGPASAISIGGTGALGDFQEIFVDGNGHLQVDVLTSALPTGGSTSALQGTLNTKIDTIDSQIDLLEGTNTIKDVEWLSNESISNQALSSVLDTEGYERVFIYGENSSSVSANNFKIFGSNASGGTYYSVGQLAVVTSDSGRYLLREDTPVADMPSPRYLKVFNNTGSSQTITKLRAVMSHKLRYV